MKEKPMERAQKSLLIGFAGGGLLVLANVPLLGLAWFTFFFARGIRQAPVEARSESESPRERLEADLEEIARDLAGDGVLIGNEEELKNAGVELRDKKGFFGGTPIFATAVRNGEEYEYDGIASEGALPEEGVLVIHGIRYARKAKRNPQESGNGTDLGGVS